MVRKLKNVVKRYLYKIQLDYAYREFLQTGKTPEKAYLKFRQMFILSKGKYNDYLSRKIVRKVGKDTSLRAEGVLGKISNEEMNSMILQMNKNGYYIFENSLELEKIKTIYQFALNEPAYPLNTEKNKYEKQKVTFDLDDLKGPRYNFQRSSILKSPDLLDLIFDDSLKAFAQEYLGCTPILDHLALWWSAPFQGKGKSKAAQLFHFDMDRIKFIKFFFYLTDVTPNNGPHCYIKGSHKKLPKRIERDGRYSNEEIFNIYGKENYIEITGEKGSIIAVDTRGFHKGKELLEDKRLLFQIEFAISMFGQNYKPLDRKKLDKKFFIKSKTYTYREIFK